MINAIIHASNGQNRVRKVSQAKILTEVAPCIRLGLTKLTYLVESMHRIVDYERPPVVETVLGVFFAPLQGFGLLHQGVFWDRVRRCYPKYELMAAIGETELRIGPQGMQPPSVRALLVEESGGQLVQVQNNGFFRNWRKSPNVPGYIHYDIMRPSFERDWTEFLKFLHSEQLPEPEIMEAQVTYINQFARGVDWDTQDELNQLFRAPAVPPQNELISGLKMHSFLKVYELRDGAGRLEVAGQPAIRQIDGKEIMQFTLTAAGKPRYGSTDDLLTWFDMGHAAVVRTFDDMTSDEAHRKWGKK